MESWLLTNELYLRLGAFFGVFLIMALWERVRPCRPLNFTRWYRWSNNLALVFLNSLILRILFPVAAVGVALLVEAEGIRVTEFTGGTAIFKYVYSGCDFRYADLLAACFIS